MNYLPGPTTATANEVIAKQSAAGSVCVYSFAETDLLIDVVGYVPVSSGVVSLVPARVFESRAAVTVDGRFANVGRVGAGEFVEVPLLGRGGVPGVWGGCGGGECDGGESVGGGVCDGVSVWGSSGGVVVELFAGADDGNGE